MRNGGGREGRGQSACEAMEVAVKRSMAMGNVGGFAFSGKAKGR